jgi:DNA polymerase-3 subunit delta'
MSEKKIIDIAQIRNMISNLNKSSFNSKPRFILIDNIEFFNLNSTNALLKILEEPPINCFFVLVNNNRKIIPTLKSRCINFKIDLTNKESYSIANKLIDTDTFDLINKELLDYYFTPGKIYNLVKFSNENKINLKTINLEKFLTFIIQENYYKKESPIKYMVFDFVELLLKKKINIGNLNFINKFLKKIGNTKKLNLDEESLFIELDSKILNV